MLLSKSYSPWTDEQVKAIQFVQNRSSLVPHVCPQHNRALIVTSDRLFCIECGYYQTWVDSIIFSITFRENYE